MKPTKITHQFAIRITCSNCGRISPKLLNTRKGAKVLTTWDCPCHAHYVVKLHAPAQIQITSRQDPLDAKICRRCGKRKAMREFQKDSAKADGHRATCKECIPRRQRPSRAAQQAAWKLKNPDKVKQYRQTHAEKKRKQARLPAE